MAFVDYVREYRDEARGRRKDGVEAIEGMGDIEGIENLKNEEARDLMWALHKAIDRCIREGVLREFFMERRGEVMKVVQLDYTYESRLEMQRKELEWEREQERQRADLAEAELRKLREELGISDGSPVNWRNIGRRFGRIFGSYEKIYGYLRAKIERKGKK